MIHATLLGRMSEMLVVPNLVADCGRQRRQFAGQVLDLRAGEEGVAVRGVGEPEDDRGRELLVVRVVVGDVWRVPQLLAPPQECLRAQFLQHAGMNKCRNEFLLHELAELPRTDTVAAVRTHSRIEELKCFFATGFPVDGEVIMEAPCLVCVGS